MTKPKTENSLVAKEMAQAEKQFDAFNESVQQLTLDRMNAAPKEEVEPVTKIAQSDIDKSNGVYLKPKRSLTSREKFNEKFRDQYNFAKEYVNFIAENREIIGETITMWTKPFPGMPAEEWDVPTGKPIWAPRYVAEQIRRKTYHRLTTEDSITGQDGFTKTYGQLVVDKVVPRLEANPVSTRKSIFMGANSF